MYLPAGLTPNKSEFCPKRKPLVFLRANYHFSKPLLSPGAQNVGAGTHGLTTTGVVHHKSMHGGLWVLQGVATPTGRQPAPDGLR